MRVASLRRVLEVLLVGLLAAWLPQAHAQPSQSASFSNEELEQLVAPVALYPDSLLAQVFMASTYPLEVVEAARFAKENPSLKDQALDRALRGETWDASVKSLVAFPQVLTMMNEKLDWTQKLGDAFLAQQSGVMDAVQRLRTKAKAEGNLETTEQQKVIVEQAPPTEVVVEQAPPTIIKIEPADPQVVYVPTYNPTVVYGAWPYPAYPPYYYYPPGYVAGASLLSFGIGMAVGASLWGDCNWGWGHGDIDVSYNNYNNFNQNVNQNWNKNEFNNKFENGKWKHDGEHRKGVGYRDKATQQRFGKGQRPGADSREAFRGRAEQGRQQMARDGGAGARRDLDRAGAGKPGSQRPGGAGAGDRLGGQQGQLGGQRGGSAASRGSQRAEPKAFQGMGSGNQVRRDANRGHSSRQSSMASRGSMGGGRSGGFGGGGGRGGGGGGRGGGGGGRR